MAVLSDADRAVLSARFQSDASATRTVLPGVTKTDIRAAIDAIDGWVDANAASFNAAIPQPARAALSARIKAELLTHVVRRRFEVS